MKKLVITIGCILAVAGAAFAQGNVNWSGISFSAMTAQTNATEISPLFGGAATGTGTIGATGGAASAGTGFYYELLYNGAFSGSQAAGPSSIASLLSWSDAGLSASNNPVTLGRLAVINGNAGATVPWSPGTTDNIVVVGWSADLGATWGAALSVLTNSSTFAPGNFLGFSTTGYITTLATTTSPGSTLFGNGTLTAQGLPIFSVLTQLYALPVPEPTTMALAGLGGLAMLLIRRRK